DAALTVREIFEAPTVAALAARIAESASAAPRPALVASPRPQRIPLSHAQTRIWLLNRLDPDSPGYNIPLTIRLTGELDVAALESAFADVLDRHESLRTVFPADAEGPHQVIRERAQRPDLTPADAAEPERAVLEFLSAGFDLRTCPPVRARLFRVDGDEHVLVAVVHHIAADGVSIAPLARDLMTAYAARSSEIGRASCRESEKM